MKYKKTLIILMVLACIGAFMYPYLIHMGDGNDDLKIKIAGIMNLSIHLIKVGVYGAFLLLALNDRILEKMNNFLLANIIVLLPTSIMLAVKTAMAPISLSWNMSWKLILLYYLFGNIIYVLVKAVQHIKSIKAK